VLNVLGATNFISKLSGWETCLGQTPRITVLKWEESLFFGGCSAVCLGPWKLQVLQEKKGVQHTFRLCKPHSAWADIDIPQSKREGLLTTRDSHYTSHRHLHGAGADCTHEARQETPAMQAPPLNRDPPHFILLQRREKLFHNVKASFFFPSFNSFVFFPFT